MADRHHGYHVSVGYTANFFPEMAPDWLDFCIRAQGFKAPRAGPAYRYLDLGSGQGFHLCLLAAANPEAEFVGVAVDPFFNNTVESDYGYTVTEWQQSYTLAIDAHASFGIKPFISNRRNSALAQLPPTTGMHTAEGLSFSLYPNPSAGVWQVETHAEAELVVVDMWGRIEFTQQLSAGKFIFEHNLKSGMYIVKVQTAQGVTTQKLRIE